MAGPIVVPLRHGRPPSFPDLCVVCGRPDPEAMRRVSGTWCFGLRRAKVDAPMCDACAVRWSAQRRLRSWIEVLWLGAAAVAAFAVLPSLGPMQAADAVVRLGIFATCMLPAWAWLLLRPLPFALRVAPEQIGFVFAGAAAADAFRRVNAAQVADRPGPRRARGAVLVALFATAGLGLLSRRHPLPGLLAEHTGDALYATAAFFLLALAWPGLRSQALAGLAFAFAAGVETAQLLDWPWLAAMRATPPGALLLGQGFQVADLFAHLVGVLLACVVDVTFLARSTRPPTGPDRVPHQSSGPAA